MLTLNITFLKIRSFSVPIVPKIKKRIKTETPLMVYIGPYLFALNYIRFRYNQFYRCLSLLRYTKNERIFYTFRHPFTGKKYNYKICRDPKLVVGKNYSWINWSSHPGNSHIDLLQLEEISKSII